MTTPLPGSSHHARVERLLLDALELPEAEQAQAVQRAAAAAPECAEELWQRFELFRRFAQIGPVGWSAPRTFGDYELLRELGRGGMGVVHLARQRRGDQERLVALKLLAPGALGSPQARQRLRREGEAVFRLVHPGICQVLDIGEVDGTPYLTMAYVPGATLAEHIAEARLHQSPLGLPASSTDGDASERGHELAQARVLRLVEQTARALHVAHEAGLVHRDVKPGNVMVTPEGEPVLLDFGLVRDDTVAAGLTATGQPLGTPTYMSPEQIDAAGPVVDRTTDVYSLGATLYEALALEPPFRAPTRAALFHQILNGRPPALPVATARGGRDLRIVVATAMAHDRARRYATALDFADDLRRVRSNQPILAKPPTPSQRLQLWCRRNPLAAVLFLLLSAALVGNGWLAYCSELRAIEARRAEAIAQEDADSTLAVIDALVDTARRHLEDVPWLEQVRAEILGKALEVQRGLLERHGNTRGQQRQRAILQVQHALTLAGLDDQAAARAQLEQAMQVLGPEAEGGHGEARRWQAKALLALAQMADAAGDRELSFDSASAAVEQFTRLLTTRPPTTWDIVTLSTARRLLAERHLEQGRGPAAAAQIDAALLETARSDDDDVRIERARVLGMRSRLHEDQQHTKAAIADCAAAIDTLRAILVKRPYDRSLRSNLACQLSDLGGLYRGQTELEQAFAAYEEGRSLFADLVTLFPQVTAYRANLASLLNRQAITLRRLGRKDEAQALLEQVLTLSEGLATESGETVSRRLGLAAVQHNLASGLKTSDRPRALRLFEQALATLEQLLEQQPDHETFHEVAMGYATSLGATLAQAARDDEAMAAFATARRHAAPLLEKNRANPSLLRSHALLSYNEGTLAAEHGNLTSASERLHEAVELARLLVAVTPTDPRAHAQLRKHRVRLAQVVEFKDVAAALPYWRQAADAVLEVPSSAAEHLARDDQAGFDAMQTERGFATSLLEAQDLDGATQALARARTRTFAPQASLSAGVEWFLLRITAARLAERHGDLLLTRTELVGACELARALAEPIRASRLHCRRVVAAIPTVLELAERNGLEERQALADLARIAQRCLD